MRTRQASSFDPSGLGTWILVIRVFHSLIGKSLFPFYSWAYRTVKVSGSVIAGRETMSPPDVRPFDLDRGGERGVLCIHGFTGTPFEVRYLGERLADRGLTVVG